VKPTRHIQIALLSVSWLPENTSATSHAYFPTFSAKGTGEGLVAVLAARSQSPVLLGKTSGATYRSHFLETFEVAF
jgi:hypothetical protein